MTSFVTFLHLAKFDWLTQRRGVTFASLCYAILGFHNFALILYSATKLQRVHFNQMWSPRGRPWPRGRPRGHILKTLALASKPQVLGLEALGPRKLPCPRLEDSSIFEPLKFCRKTPETSRKICKYLFHFAQLKHKISQAGLSHN